jgi:hypothetical protein
MSQNGIEKKGWNLAKDGMLWKRVLDYTTKEFHKQAEAFVAQLQQSVKPADALQGLLLDRMAAGYLRKQLMLEVEAAGRQSALLKLNRELSGSTPEIKAVHVLANSLPFQSLSWGNVLRYEALLDQGFHRDLILLQKLKELAPVGALSRRGPQKSNGGLIKGEMHPTDVD